MLMGVAQFQESQWSGRAPGTARVVRLLGFTGSDPRANMSPHVLVIGPSLKSTCELGNLAVEVELAFEHVFRRRAEMRRLN
jgi:hypothetical protein